MAYIRYGTLLPNGDKSKSFVIGDPDSLVNLDNSKRIPYSELKEILKYDDDYKSRSEIGKRLCIENSELEFVCETLFKERDNEEWD